MQTPDASESHADRPDDAGQPALDTLLRRSAEGDRAAFSAFYDATVPWVHGLAEAMFGPGDDAAEATVRTYLTAWEEASEASLDLSEQDDATHRERQVFTWLEVLAHRVMTSLRRAGGSAAERGRRPGPAGPAALPEDLMDRVDPDAFEAVRLAWLGGCTDREVADRLDLPADRARTLLRDGVRQVVAARRDLTQDGARPSAPAPASGPALGAGVREDVDAGRTRELADLSGNGTADIVGFGYSGVTVSHGRADRTFDGTGKRIDSYGWDRGWRIDKNPRMLADVDGNSTADIVGFGDAGTYVSYFSALGDTFTQPALEIRNFGYAQGWRVGQHPRMLADVNVNPAGNAAADIIGFGYSGVSVAHSLNGGNYTGVALRVNDFGQAQGWRGDRHLRTHADINVDGIQDLVGFGNAGVYVAHGRADGTFAPVYLKVAAFGSDQGWTEDRYPRLLGDVNGDGRDDVVGFGHSATYVQLS